MTPKEALKRGGHKHPGQIIKDLERGGCHALSGQELDAIEDRAYHAGYLEGIMDERSANA